MPKRVSATEAGPADMHDPADDSISDQADHFADHPMESEPEEDLDHDGDAGHH